jgi:hypothetical protein
MSTAIIFDIELEGLQQCARPLLVFITLVALTNGKCKRKPLFVS